MGACLSSKASESNDEGRNTANVITANGDLHKYTVPLTVSHVLEMEFRTKQLSVSKFFFVCNSDRLYYDNYITALDADHQLQSDLIYFVLPVSKLQYRLSASDMAALAVNGSLALQKSIKSPSKSKKHSPSPSTPSFFLRNNKSVRISPILVDPLNGDTSDGVVDCKDENVNGMTVTTIKSGISNYIQPASATKALGVSNSGSTRKLQRYSSPRGKMVARSFKTKLTTITEEPSISY